MNDEHRTNIDECFIPPASLNSYHRARHPNGMTAYKGFCACGFCTPTLVSREDVKSELRMHVASRKVRV
jgi:hypothetical protein